MKTNRKLRAKPSYQLNLEKLKCEGKSELTCRERATASRMKEYLLTNLTISLANDPNFLGTSTG